MNMVVGTAYNIGLLVTNTSTKGGAASAATLTVAFTVTLGGSQVNSQSKSIAMAASGQATFTFPYTPAAAGSGTITAVLQDPNGNTLNTVSESITVSAATPTTGTLVLSFSPSAAAVVISGTEYAMGTYSLAPGTYTWGASATGYASQSGSITITAGGTTTLTITLVATPTNTLAVCLVYYGSNTSSTNSAITTAKPEFIVNNSPAGPWKGNANIKTFTGAGIKYFEYMTGGYEGTESGEAIPNTLSANLGYIAAVAAAGGTGIFLDEVTGTPDAASVSYLTQIVEAAHAAGLLVCFNPGDDDINSTLMSCGPDYVNCDENYTGETLSAAAQQYKSQVWLLSTGVASAAAGAALTEEAWAAGYLAHYPCNDYADLPSWLDAYAALLVSPTPPATGNMVLSYSPSAAAVVVGGTEYTPGTYSLAPGTYTWGASATGYTSQSGSITITAGGTATLSINLVATPPASTGSLVGVVTDKATGATLEGALVTATGPTTYTATSGSDGSYSISGMTAGSYAVTSVLAGYETFTD